MRRWTVMVLVVASLLTGWSGPNMADGQESGNEVPMFRGGPERRGAMPGPGPAGEPVEAWHFTTNGPAGAVFSVTVAGDTVYAGSEIGVHALDATTGAERWRFATGGRVTSSPAGVVYVGSFDRNLYALDAATGVEKWHFATGGEVQSSPAVVAGVVYVGSRDSSVYALEAATGVEKWRFVTGFRVTSSPAVVDGVVYVGSNDSNVYALDAATGTELWLFSTADAV
jgi:outer membrane protein assembly factor BamB